MPTRLDEGLDGVDVKVVAGLVQQQDVRLLEGDLGQRHAALLAACVAQTTKSCTKN